MFGILQTNKKLKNLAADQPDLLESPLGTRRLLLYVITSLTGPKFLTVWVAKTEEGATWDTVVLLGGYRARTVAILQKLAEVGFVGKAYRIYSRVMS